MFLKCRNRYPDNVGNSLRRGGCPEIEQIEARLLMTTVYSVTDLGTLGGGGTSVQAINDVGQIVGGSDIKNGVQHPFLYSKGKMIDLGVPAGNASAKAVAINGKGHVLIIASNHQPGRVAGRCGQRGHGH